MTPFRMIAGLIIIIVGAILFGLNHTYSLITLIVGVVVVASSFAGSQGHIKRRVSRITSEGIVEAGLQRIKAGKMRISEDTFREAMGKIMDIIANQSVMPEFGLDSVYLSYAKSSEAESVSSIISSRGIRNDVIQEKGSWKVRLIL